MKDASEHLNEHIDSALKKKAFGFDSKETVEEYAEGEDGGIKLTKKKVTIKFVPPDVTALKMLLDKSQPISALSDDQLQAEKERLLRLLKESEISLEKKKGVKNAKRKKSAENAAKTSKKGVDD